MMNLFNLFKKNNTKNFLRVYANAGKVNYSSAEKQSITECLISLATSCLGKTKPKFDISGSGYGFSKGSSRIGEKSFRNRLKKKGFESMWGMTVGSDEANYDSSFILMSPAHPIQYMECSFYWSIGTEQNMDYCLDILKRISEIAEINYAYAYPAKENLMLGECYIKNGIFYSEIKRLPAVLKWNKNWAESLDGKIRKLFPMNCFNAKQLENLVEIKPVEKTPLGNGSEIWKIADDEIERGNKILNNLIETG